MARRSPATVRAGLPIRPRPCFSTVPDVPWSILADVHRAEATVLRSGAVNRALVVFRRRARSRCWSLSHWVVDRPFGEFLARWVPAWRSSLCRPGAGPRCAASSARPRPGSAATRWSTVARRSPAAARARLPVRPHWGREFSVIPGLLRWVLADVHRVEAIHLRSGAVATAVRDLRGYARNAHLDGSSATLDCPCCEPLTRWNLEVALRALPPRSRAALRAVPRPLDNEIHRKSLPDPAAPPDWPRWMRRVAYRGA